MIPQRVQHAIMQQVNGVRPVARHAAHGLVAEIYAQIEQDFGAIVAPFSLHSPDPQVLASSWAITRETLVVPGSVQRRTKEAVAAAVSKANQCPFCVDVHTTALSAFAEHDLAAAILAGQTSQVSDPKIRSLVEWAAATRSPEAAILRAPPFSRAEAPEIIGTALAFHYINRMVNLFLDKSPFPLPPGLSGLKGVLRRVISPLLKGLLTLSPLPGASLHFLPEAELVDNFAWAAPNAAIAGAFARATAAIEAAGRRALPAEVRALVHARVAAWKGEDPGMSRRWVEDAMGGLAEESKPAARLALLTALASHQVDEDIINAFRAWRSGDDTLIAATAWASFTAARRVGTWLHAPVS